MNKARWIGIDIGGANLKLASNDGWSCSTAFALWKHPERLAETLSNLIPKGDVYRCVVTMTGELADCFQTHCEGVRSIVDAAAIAAADAEELYIYTLDGNYISGAEAKKHWRDVAAANWHGLANFATRYVKSNETGLLLDIGSTTVDLIPFDSRGVLTESRADVDRLMQSELLYFGVRRTPICAVVKEFPYRGNQVPLMAELFATTDDCALALGRILPAPHDTDSADNRARTVENAVDRLARMIGLDNTSFTLPDAQIASRYVESVLSSRIDRAAHCLASEATTWVLSGHGSWLAPTPTARVICLGETLGPDLARNAPAYAIAKLADERFS